MFRLFDEVLMHLLEGGQEGYDAVFYLKRVGERTRRDELELRHLQVVEEVDQG